ncbi:hypothetical protein D3C87_1478850 [compost metagenome]
MIRHVRLVQALEALFVLGPREFAAVDDGAAHGGAVATQVFGQRMDDDVGAMLDGAEQIGAGHRVIDDQRDAVRMRDLGQFRHIGDIAQRVADRFAEDGLGACIDQGGEGLGLARVGEAHLDADLWQGVGKQVVGAAIQLAGGDEIVARFGNRLDRVGDGRHARRHGQRGHAAFQRRDPFFQHVLRGVHDARVDVTCHLEVEQVGAMLGIVEGVGHRLVNGDGGCLGGRVGGIAGVHGQGFDSHVVSGFNNLCGEIRSHCGMRPLARCYA